MHARAAASVLAILLLVAPQVSGQEIGSDDLIRTGANVTGSTSVARSETSLSPSRRLALIAGSVAVAGVAAVLLRRSGWMVSRLASGPNPLGASLASRARVIYPAAPVQRLTVPGLTRPVEVLEGEGIKLYRGLKAERVRSLRESGRLTIQDPFPQDPRGGELGWALVEHSGGSTSRCISLTSDPRIARIHAGRGGRIVEVTLPRGTRAYGTAGFSRFDGSSSSLGESEWLVFREIPGSHVRFITRDELQRAAGVGVMAGSRSTAN